jgi:peroxiredoxin
VLNRWLGWAVGTMLMLTLLGAGLRPQQTPPMTPRPEMGYPAPDFTLTDLDGNRVTLSSLRGQVVLLNFWATWCGPCRVEMPEMRRLHELGMEELVILGVNLTDTEGSLAGVRQYVSALGLQFPILLDSDGGVARTYRAISIPTSFVIGQDGIIRVKHIGPMTAATMENYARWAREVR